MNIPMDQRYKGIEHLLRALPKDELDRINYRAVNIRSLGLSKHSTQQQRNEAAGIGKRAGLWRRILDDLTDAYHWLMP